MGVVSTLIVASRKHYSVDVVIAWCAFFPEHILTDPCSPTMPDSRLAVATLDLCEEGCSPFDRSLTKNSCAICGF